MTEELKIGIMGGTFDPIHNGHTQLAEEALSRFALSRVLFIPAGDPPHKKDRKLAGGFHRYNMTRLAISQNPAFSALDMELTRGGVTYTQDTLTQLKEQHPRAEFYYIIGADTLFELYTWKNIREVARLTRFIVAGRPTVAPETLFAAAQRMREDFSCRLYDLGFTGPDYSSREIRALLQDKKSIAGMVAPEVEAYIRQNGLYRD